MQEFEIEFSESVNKFLESIWSDNSMQRKVKKIQKALDLLKSNYHHPGLNTHFLEPRKKFNHVRGSYIENKTPSAWRLFWIISQTSRTIIIVDIGPHPKTNNDYLSVARSAK